MREPMHRRPIVNHGRIGFTLIEVLVVVAIIVLLIAILLPSLNKARAQARTAVCLANMKQLGNGMVMYKSDYRGWLPVGPADRIQFWDPIDKKYYEQAAPGRKPLPVQNCGWGGKRSGYNHDWKDPPREEVCKRPLTHYFYRGTSLDTDVPVFRCPSDTGFDARTWPGRPPEYMAASAYETCGNSYWINPWGAVQGDKAHIVRTLSRIIVAEDAALYFSIAQGRQLDGWHDRFSRHNILFLDFHAANVYVNPDPYDPVLNASFARRQYQGADWFFINYFEIMDYYR